MVFLHVSHISQMTCVISGATEITHQHVNSPCVVVADDLLAAFTLPHNPAVPPLVAPHQASGSAALRPPHHSSTSSSVRQLSSQAGIMRQSASMVHSVISSGAEVWQENLRVAQEGLTLLRIILNDASLGTSPRSIAMHASESNWATYIVGAHISSHTMHSLHPLL